MRARTNWLSQGDRNTKYFHAYATTRKNKNLIQGLEDENGQWMVKETEKARIIGRYFSDLFTSTFPSDDKLKEVVNSVEEGVSDETRIMLAEPYTKEDIEKAVFNMHPTKAPGPDGFNGRFFQKLWPEVGEVVIKAALGVLSEGADLQE